jgi:site-specific DNA-methyltransferase (adenine-specific)
MKVTDKIEITNEDNMELMARYPDNYFDLAIVDPPYGIDWMQQIQNPNTKANWKQYENKEWDKQTPTDEYWEQLFRVSKNQIVWGGNYMTDKLYPSSCWIIWDKMQEFSGAVFEMAWTSFKSPAKAFRMSRVEAYANQNKIHPTQKPVSLYKWILDTYAVCKTCKNEHGYFEDVAGDGGSKMWQPCEDCYHEETGTNGFKILDTHLGSGSIAIACHDYGFDLTACELDKEYFDKAIERIKNHVSQQKLF